MNNRRYWAFESTEKYLTPRLLVFKNYSLRKMKFAKKYSEQVCGEKVKIRRIAITFIK